MAIQSLQRLQAIAALENEKLKTVSEVPKRLATTFQARVDLLTKAIGKLTLVKYEEGSTETKDKGGRDHILRKDSKDTGVATVNLFRASYKSATHTAFIEWKQGVGSMGTAWYIKVDGFPKAVAPSNKWNEVVQNFNS